MRYLTGLPLRRGRGSAVSGESGKFLVGAEDVWVLADSRYTIAVQRDCPDSTMYVAELAARRHVGGHRRDRGRPAGRGRGDDDPAPHLGAASRGRAGRRARPDRGLGRGRAGRRRIRRSSSGSPLRARSRIERWPRSCRRSGPASPSRTSRWTSSGGSGRAARTGSRSTSRASPVPRRRCRTASPGLRRSSRARCCCSTSARRSRAIAAT